MERKESSSSQKYRQTRMERKNAVDQRNTDKQEWKEGMQQTREIQTNKNGKKEGKVKTTLTTLSKFDSDSHLYHRAYISSFLPTPSPFIFRPLFFRSFQPFYLTRLSYVLTTITREVPNTLTCFPLRSST